MQQPQILLYGAYGYTGELIARKAAKDGQRLLLCGRRGAPLEKLAAELGMPWKAFGLEEPSVLDDALEGISAVLHAAGPFSHTAAPMMDACIRNGVHYLDITGEIAVFEQAAKLGPRAAKAGIMLMPGTGFDVVPTDCMAALLKEKLPAAEELSLAFATRGGRYSRGTALTMAENLGGKSAIRKNGKITAVPLGHKSRKIAFAPDFDRLAMTIPWGDVSTAYYTTGIPNIEVYTAVHPKTHSRLKYQKYFNWFLRLPVVRKRAQDKIRRGAAGPSPEEREAARSYIWGEARAASGQKVSGRAVVPEGYTLTAATSLLIAGKAVAGDFKAGFQTPAGCYGPQLMSEVPGAAYEFDLTGDE